jgi:cysteine desulfurase
MLRGTMLNVYLDHNATTPVHPEVLERLSEWAKHWGNPSSVHKASREPKTLIRETRKALAEYLKVHPLELIFTSGGSESNNLAIKGIFFALQKLGRTHFITTAIEHPSVMKAFEFLESQGATVDYIPVDIHGNLDLDFYKNKLSEKTALVSVMLANNETGVIHPIQEMCALAHEKGALFHTDAVQALGKMDVDLEKLGVDLASFSGHKFYSLKGTGILFQKRGTPLESLISGGGQERGRRAGTENTLAIASLGYMISKKDEILQQNERIKTLRDDMEKRIVESISQVHLMENSNRLPNTSSLFIEGVDGETLLMNLDMHGVCVSTGAACSSGSQEPSAVLRAMGFTRKQAQGSLRISLGWHNNAEQIEYFLEVLKKVVTRIRQFSNTTENKAL